MNSDQGNRSFAYLRVSGRDQIDGDGFPRQLAACAKYASANGLILTRTFRECAVSGTKDLDARPALLDLIECARQGNVDIILIEKLDRLARDLMVQETILGDLRRRGLTLISTAEPDLNSDDPSRVLIRQVFGAIAQYERAMIVAKLRGARIRDKAKNGRCEGRKPFGMRPGEDAILAHMRSLRAAGATWTQIADALNAAGMAPRMAQAWRAATIQKVLSRRKEVCLSSNV